MQALRLCPDWILGLQTPQDPHAQAIPVSQERETATLTSATRDRASWSDAQSPRKCAEQAGVREWSSNPPLLFDACNS
eukprot:1230092-Rhodomonas_salina.1